MPTIEVSSQELLDVVKRLPPDEFKALIDAALAERPQPPSTLSAEETNLVMRINRGLPSDLQRRFAQLRGRHKNGKLTAEEHHELLGLTREAESQDADRAAALLELAGLRLVPVRSLMKQMGIKAPAIHG